MTTDYVLDGDRVLVETRSNGITLFFTYDVDSTLLSMNYNGNEYFYITNMQGDIIELVDINGNSVVKYKYDAWGNIISQTGGSLADINPYRYRGYRYDVETGWYYLQSRYYDPAMGRFINVDGLTGKNGNLLTHNMYAYANNNPVMNVDPNGDFPILITAVLAIWLLLCLKADNSQTVIDSDLASGRIFYTYEDAANAWGQKNGQLTLSHGLERGAFVYTSVRADGNTYYHLSKTYKGKHNNVVSGFIRGFIWSRIHDSLNTKSVVGFIHTHPNSHKDRDNTSNADKFLMYLNGISRGSIYDKYGAVIHYDRFGCYDLSGNYYPSNSSNIFDAFWLMITNGHG